GAFPARFQLDILHPPPASVSLTSDPQKPAAYGLVFAVTPGAGRDGMLKLKDLRGYSAYRLVYLGGTEPWVGDACRLGSDNQVTCPTESIPAGFHILRNLCTKGGVTVDSEDHCLVLVDPQESIGMQLAAPLDALFGAVTENMDAT